MLSGSSSSAVFQYPLFRIVRLNTAAFVESRTWQLLSVSALSDR